MSTWLEDVSTWLEVVSTWLRWGEHMARGGEHMAREGGARGAGASRPFFFIELKWLTNSCSQSLCEAGLKLQRNALLLRIQEFHCSIADVFSPAPTPTRRCGHGGSTWLR